jgi:hypothetical protein
VRVAERLRDVEVPGQLAQPIEVRARRLVLGLESREPRRELLAAAGARVEAAAGGEDGPLLVLGVRLELGAKLPSRAASRGEEARGGGSRGGPRRCGRRARRASPATSPRPSGRRSPRRRSASPRRYRGRARAPGTPLRADACRRSSSRGRAARRRGRGRGRRRRARRRWSRWRRLAWKCPPCWVRDPPPSSRRCVRPGSGRCRAVGGSPSRSHSRRRPDRLRDPAGRERGRGRRSRAPSRHRADTRRSRADSARGDRRRPDARRRKPGHRHAPPAGRSASSRPRASARSRGSSPARARTASPSIPPAAAPT